MISITLTNSISDEYQDFIKLFAKEALKETLSAHQFWDHKILIIKDKILEKTVIYSLSSEKLKTLQMYLDKNLKKEFIRKSQLSAEYSILFISKKDKKLWLYVNYRELNNIMIKNSYLLSLILELQD